MTRKLYEINDDILSIAEIAEAGDIVGAEAFEKDLTLEAADKLVNYYHVIKSLEADVALADDALARAQAFKKKKAAAIDWLEGRIIATMQLLGQDKLDRPDVRITLCGGRKSFKTCEAKDLPPEFMNIIEVADWKAVQAAVDAGRIIPGCDYKTGSPFLKYPKIKADKE